jgi:hypothetical protein
MILMTIRMKVLPEKRKELHQTLVSLTDRIRTQNGCGRYDFCVSAEDENETLHEFSCPRISGLDRRGYCPASRGWDEEKSLGVPVQNLSSISTREAGKNGWVSICQKMENIYSHSKKLRTHHQVWIKVGELKCLKFRDAE